MICRISSAIFGAVRHSKFLLPIRRSSILSAPIERTMPNPMNEDEMIKLNDNLYARVYTYEGYLLVDIRKIWRRDGVPGIFPTKQGVSMRDTWFEEFKEHIPSIEEAIKRVMEGGQREEMLICGNEKNGLFVTADEAFIDYQGQDLPSINKRIEVDIRKCRVDMENKYITKGVRLNLLEWANLNKKLPEIDEKVDLVRNEEDI